MPNNPTVVEQWRPIKPLNIHEGSVIATLMDLLSIPSPAGYTVVTSGGLAGYK